MYTIHGGRGFESDELHESVGVFGAVATTLQSDPTWGHTGCTGAIWLNPPSTNITIVLSADEVADRF